MKRAIVGLALLVAALAYLRDPAWLIDVSSGLRSWEQDASGMRYRWSGGHASFFVPSDAIAIRIPLATTFERRDPPMLVVVTVDDVPAGRLLLLDPGWEDLIVPLPPRGSRRVRRIDVRTSLTRDDNHGVKIATVEIIRRQLAAMLLRSMAEHGTQQAAELDRYPGRALRGVVEPRSSAFPIAVRLPGDVAGLLRAQDQPDAPRGPL